VKNRRKTAAEIRAIRESGRMLATVLQTLQQRLQPGMTTLELDQIAQAELKGLGGKPAFLGFEGFPASLCVSVNDELIHGVPGPRVIGDGDLVGMDFGVNYQGMITDAAVTVGVGRVAPAAQRLLQITEESMARGIATVYDGAHTGDIGAAVEACLNAAKLGIVREFCGHGVGHNVHEEPAIPNYGKPGKGDKLSAGMTIAIEPMAMLGSEAIQIDPDNWTGRTADGSLGAHFEHTVLVTGDGYEILTKI